MSKKTFHDYPTPQSTEEWNFGGMEVRGTQASNPFSPGFAYRIQVDMGNEFHELSSLEGIVKSLTEDTIRLAPFDGRPITIINIRYIRGAEFMPPELGLFCREDLPHHDDCRLPVCICDCHKS